MGTNRAGANSPWGETRIIRKQYLLTQPAVKLCLFSSHESHLMPSTPNLQLHSPYSLQLTSREPSGLQLQAKERNTMKFTKISTIHHT